MEKNIALLLLSLITLSSLASCSQDAMDYLDRTGTISFYDGSNKIGDITGKSGDKFTIVDLAKISSYEDKENFAFRGWYSDKALTKPENLKYYTYKDYSVYGNFKPYVTISFDANGGKFNETETISTMKGVAGDQITKDLPTPKKEKASFSGWYFASPNEHGVIDEFNEFKFPEADLTLVAHYDEWPTLKFELPSSKFGDLTIDSVKLDPEKLVSDQFTFKDEITNIITPDVDDNYKFEGWFIKKEIKEGLTEDDLYKDCPQFFFNQKLDHDITIFPSFNDKVTLNFVVDGADNNEVIFKPVSKYSGEKVNAPEITDNIKNRLKEINPTSYFTGWATKDEKGTLSPYSFIKMPEKDLTLYATFEKNPVFKVYTDNTKTHEIYSLNTYAPDENIILNDLPDLDMKLGLNESKQISSWILEKNEMVEGSLKTTTSQLTKEEINGKLKSCYSVNPKDTKFTSLNFYPIYEHTYTLKIYEANYVLDSALMRNVPTKTTNVLTEIKGSVDFHEPNITLDESKKKIKYYKEVTKDGKSSLEEVSFPLSTENGYLKEIYLLLAKKVNITVGDVYVNNVKITSSPVGTINLGYQKVLSQYKMFDIDNTLGTLVINGDVSKKITNDALKNLEIIDIQMLSDGRVIEDLNYNHEDKLFCPFDDLGSTSNPINIRILTNM